MCPRQTQLTGRPSFSSTRHLRGRKTNKYALTVVDVDSRFKETEPLTLKDLRLQALFKKFTNAGL